ncbi:MAG: hypothetical protein A3E78_11365 [Alphaproteobacteria bacterium RIFCSPHIGHO2_12_FULL_63_12]|nr:MAG: hypothetical protein A3E78_11365 [Alphaproteobacteria bacterium RIFCSPHIGHO2_12_FULL_63_12]
MFRKAALLLSAIATIACATSSKSDLFNNRDCNFYGASFCIESIGDGIYVENGPDFLVYNFGVEEKNVLAIYEGDYPQVFGPEEFLPKRIGGVAVKYREFDDGETVHRYFYNEGLGRPKALHMMSPKEMNDRQRQFVDNALASLHYCRPSGASMICN